MLNNKSTSKHHICYNTKRQFLYRPENIFQKLNMRTTLITTKHDFKTTAMRSSHMKKIKNKNTKPEIILEKPCGLAELDTG